MTTLHEAAQKALEALEACHSALVCVRERGLLSASAEILAEREIKALRTALAQQGEQPVAWQPIETAPFGVQVLVTAEFDGPNDWRIKVGDKDAQGHWIVYGASWKPTHWMPLPPAPKGADK